MIAALNEALERNEPVALATVVDVQGASPAQVGFKLLVRPALPGIGGGKTMPGKGPDMWRQASCCGGDRRVTQIQIGNAIIGLVGLEETLEQLHAANRRPGPAAADELLVRIKARNYVARGDEEDYKVALLREYTAYRAARQEEKRR